MLHWEPVTSHEALFDSLIPSVRWDERVKARRTASFGASSERIGDMLGLTPNDCLLVKEEK